MDALPNIQSFLDNPSCALPAFKATLEEKWREHGHIVYVNNDDDHLENISFHVISERADWLAKYSQMNRWEVIKRIMEILLESLYRKICTVFKIKPEEKANLLFIRDNMRCEYNPIRTLGMSDEDRDVITLTVICGIDRNV